MRHLPLLLVCAGLIAACSGGDSASDASVSDAPASDAVGEVAADVVPEVAPDLSPDPGADTTASPTYAVPLEPGSPWPKFRRDAAQTGASPLVLTDDGRARRAFQTGKGIFSSPVIDAAGNVYVGSADRVFYALDAAGAERWRVSTGEIIDSAALLDDKGRVYFGSGDGFLYALEAASGAEVWRHQADAPEPGEFLNWYEGNVAMLPDGTLLVPNDNFEVYALDRDTGARRFFLQLADQTWSLPAVDVERGRLFLGNNNVLPGKGNTFGYDLTGQRQWKFQSLGTIAASPLLLPDGAIALGGFDGLARVHEPADGAVRWTFAARDHLYASAALHPEGFAVLPGADGTVYALDLADGAVRWA